MPMDPSCLTVANACHYGLEEQSNSLFDPWMAVMVLISVVPQAPLSDSSSRLLLLLASTYTFKQSDRGYDHP